MIKGLGLLETKEYKSIYDKVEPKTVWILGVLDSDIFDLLGGNEGNKLSSMAETVKFGLKGFTNFKDASGNDVTYATVSKVIGNTTYKVVADNIMKIIPPQVKYELANEIIKISQISEEERKN